MSYEEKVGKMTMAELEGSIFSVMEEMEDEEAGQPSKPSQPSKPGFPRSARKAKPARRSWFPRKARDTEVHLDNQAGPYKTNPAIAYSIVMSIVKMKDDEEALACWGYLYKLSMDECTHMDIDGNSSWNHPYEDRDYKVCDYCSWN